MVKISQLAILLIPQFFISERSWFSAHLHTYLLWSHILNERNSLRTDNSSQINFSMEMKSKKRKLTAILEAKFPVQTTKEKKTLIFTSSKRLTSNVKSVSPRRSPDCPPLSPITQFLLVNDYAAWRNHIWLTYAPGPSQVQAYKSYKIKREKKKRYKYVNEYLR